MEILANGNYIVLSPDWNNSGVGDTGAVTFSNGTTGTIGTISTSNSVLGTASGGGIALAFSYDMANSQLVVGRPADNLVTLFRPGNNVQVRSLFDFDGDGKLDAAILRASNNSIYIRNSSDNSISYDSWGLSTDIFVNADYDGDGKTDLAVFRNGVWYIKQSSNNRRVMNISDSRPIH